MFPKIASVTTLPWIRPAPPPNEHGGGPGGRCPGIGACGGQRIDRPLAYFVVRDEPETLGQDGAQHREDRPRKSIRVGERRSLLGLHHHVETVLVDPVRSADHLARIEGVSLMRQADEPSQRVRGEGVATWSSTER
jgi:hypothetical protein